MEKDFIKKKDKVEKAFKKIKQDMKFNNSIIEKTINSSNLHKKQIEKLIDELLIVKERLTKIEDEIREINKVNYKGKESAKT